MKRTEKTHPDHILHSDDGIRRVSGHRESDGLDELVVPLSVSRRDTIRELRRALGGLLLALTEEDRLGRELLVLEVDLRSAEAG